MVDFGGWDMPVGYGSQIEEHHAVRRDAGMFDVSHMCVVDLRGAGVRPLLLRLLANDVGRLAAPGKALYSCMLRPDGGVIDDLIACYLDEKWFRVVVNAGTADKDLAWIKEHAKQIGVAVVPRRDLAMIAIQGPNARAKSMPLLPEGSRAAAGTLGHFFGAAFDDEWFVSRTGYTGEDGFEVALPAEAAAAFWNGLTAAGVAPCGLGARDTLRLEAGMNLYGNDMDETVSPLESGLAWTVALDGTRDFIGKAALDDAARRRRRAPAHGIAAGRSRRAARAPEGFRGRRRRGRSHERDILADARALDRARPPAGRGHRESRGGHPRQAHPRAHRQAAVREERQGPHRILGSRRTS